MKRIKAAHNDLVAAQIIFEKSPEELKKIKSKRVGMGKVRRVSIEDVEAEIRSRSIERTLVDPSGRRIS